MLVEPDGAIGDSKEYSLADGATVLVGPDGDRFEGDINGLTGEDTAAREPERTLLGRHTLTGNLV